MCIRDRVVGPVEQELLAAEAPGADVRVLSNIHELRPAPRPYGEREGLLFVGGFRHPPNVLSLIHISEPTRPY